MITPRTTRLIRTRSLRAFQIAVAASCGGSAAGAAPSLVLVPTRAAARQLRWTFEHARPPGAPVIGAPDVLTRGEMYERLTTGACAEGAWLSAYARSALLERGAMEAITEGFSPPFNLRPALVGEMLELYDELRRHQQDVEHFERLLIEELEPSASSDRGAERVLRQTRFLACAFRVYQRELRAVDGVDEHELRNRLLTSGVASPWSSVVVTVGDRRSDRGGLWPADFDLISRLDGIDRVDIVATEAQLAAGFHGRIHDLLPGIEEVRFDPADPGSAHSPPVLEVPSPERPYFVSRDREEELRDSVRRIRAGRSDADRTAIVFARRLPYLYLAREVLAGAGVPYQCDDALPLAAEPVAAAVDLVMTFAESDAGRLATVALLRSPHFDFADEHPCDDWAGAVSALDAALADAGFVRGRDRLAAIAGQSGAPPARAAASAAAELEPLFGRAAARVLLGTLNGFLARHWTPSADERDIRSRRAVAALLEGLTAAYTSESGPSWDAETLAAVVRRWIEDHIFEPRTGAGGVHLVDAASARYGAFDRVHLVGLLDGEWPERRRRNIFYSSFLLKRLGWVDDADPAAPPQAAFDDLLRLAANTVSVSTLLLEDDALVEPSPLLEALESCGFETRVADVRADGIFTDEALIARTAAVPEVAGPASPWLELRRRRGDPSLPRFRGAAAPHRPSEHGVSSVELYAHCPFKYFARHVLRLREELDEEDGLTPRDRGLFVHEVLHAFFERWQASGRGAITPGSYDDAQAQLEEVAGPLLARLPPADASLERARLFGSPAAPGIADLVLRMEAGRPVGVVERWLEERFSGRLDLQGGSGSRAVPVRGVTDRVDVLADRSLRVLDYKASVPLVPLQVAIYAESAVQRARAVRPGRWSVSEAAYVVYGGRRGVRSLARRGEALDAALVEAQRAFVAAVDAIEAGAFPPRPADRRLCASCAYATVCRKQYAVESDDEDDFAAV